MKKRNPYINKKSQQISSIINTGDVSDTNLSSQRQRLITYLREKGSITTLEARGLLNILAPAARVYELRHKEGHNIVRYWTDDLTSEGRKHRVAKYVLLSGKYNKEKREVSKVMPFTPDATIQACNETVPAELSSSAVVPAGHSKLTYERSLSLCFKRHLKQITIWCGLNSSTVGKRYCNFIINKPSLREV